MLRRAAPCGPRPLVRPLRASSKRYQGNKSQPKDEAEAAASCPIFTRPGAAHPTPLPDSKLLRLFRRVPPDVIHSIHSLYWILVGGAVPRHLQEQSFVRFPSMEWWEIDSSPRPKLLGSAFFSAP
ncbi:unnamed protein product [Durusdinium trenchii]|uniref:Uncharacterized protein n=2 Tax=Durusdinium trenchii TaxID=1381693 RepID=A0ABP0R2N9_9DINO